MNTSSLDLPEAIDSNSQFANIAGYILYIHYIYTIYIYIWCIIYIHTYYVLYIYILSFTASMRISWCPACQTGSGWRTSTVQCPKSSERVGSGWSNGGHLASDGFLLVPWWIYDIIWYGDASKPIMPYMCIWLYMYICNTIFWRYTCKFTSYSNGIQGTRLCLDGARNLLRPGVIPRSMVISHLRSVGWSSK